MHRHDDGKFFPAKAGQGTSAVGRGSGEGRNVNIPFSGGAMGVAEYEAAFTKIVLPIASEFNPELIFISAGFDAAKGNPLGGYEGVEKGIRYVVLIEYFNIMPETYAWMTHHLLGLAGGKIIAVLEGGYNLESISVSAEAVLKTLTSGTIMSQVDKEHSVMKRSQLVPGTWSLLRELAQTQAVYWNCLKDYQVDQRSTSEKGQPTQPDVDDLQKDMGKLNTK